MKPALAILACASCLAVDTHFLNTLAQVESSGNPKAIGDSGKAAGLFQFHKGTWEDTSKLRKASGTSVYDYQHAFDPMAARIYAQTWCNSLERRLERAIGHAPSNAQIWCAWNMGYNGFKRINFNVSRAPKTTQQKAKRF